MSETQRVAVLGGSGGTGQELVTAALKEGLRVRALYRLGSEPRDPPSGLDIVEGS